MIWHPLVWAYWVAAATGGLLYFLGALRAMDVVLNWAPRQADIDQLQRERHAETAALLGHWAHFCLTAAATMALGGIALVWYHTVPGAMCGTGVLQAMGTDGSRAMIFWGVTLILLHAWRVLDRLDSHHPQGVVTQTGARMMISAAPFFVLAVFFSWQALMRVETVPPVSCCAAVYDQVLNSPSAAMNWRTPLTLWCSLAGSTVLLFMAVVKGRSPTLGSSAMPALIAVLWGIGTTVAIKRVWSAYYYQVLSHPCPWCLFLPDQYGAGFFIFGGMAVVVIESLALWLADRTRIRHPALADPAARRIRQAAWRITISIMGVMLLTMGPAIAWRLRTGAWLDGSF